MRHHLREMRRPARRSLLLGATLVVVLATSARPAAAVDNVCGNETHQNACNRPSSGCICCFWSGLSGNCTWWAWESACRNWGYALPTCYNAQTWDTDYVAAGIHVDTTPCAATIFVCEAFTSVCNSGDVGHVGWVVDAFPNGSIAVDEMGCWSWDGRRQRTFDAQNAVPTMHYLYEPGKTSCVACECTPNETESRSCPCGAPDETRTCAQSCTWGAWSGCETTGGECVAMTHENCGGCGLRQCTTDCVWGPCQDPCADAGAIEADAAPADAAPADAAPADDALADDGGAPRQPVTPGCGCSGSGSSDGGAGSLGLALLSLLSLLALLSMLALAGGRRRRAARPTRSS